MDVEARGSAFVVGTGESARVVGERLSGLAVTGRGSVLGAED